MNPSRTAQTWIIILLLWNLACLGAVLFYLIRLSSDRLDPSAVATLCANAAHNACDLQNAKP